MSFAELIDPDEEPVDLLEDVVDSTAVQIEVAPDDEPDQDTAAAMRVMRQIDEAYAAGKPNMVIPCPFCGKPLRYRKDEQGKIAECPGDDFVAIS
ncbi:MAG: hypothetical protein QHJ73_08415 [Armatimonadota bacterium]|nr:hypothetical protein [Armatimonadota bacterium]